MKQYPCGCSASGGLMPLPDYCPIHEKCPTCGNERMERLAAVRTLGDTHAESEEATTAQRPVGEGESRLGVAIPGRRDRVQDAPDAAVRTPAPEHCRVERFPLSEDFKQDIARNIDIGRGVGRTPAAQPDVTINDVGDAVCEHGTAMDVHCCNCHGGFLFDAETCVCLSRPGGSTT